MDKCKRNSSKILIFEVIIFLFVFIVVLPIRAQIIFEETWESFDVGTRNMFTYTKDWNGKDRWYTGQYESNYYEIVSSPTRSGSRAMKFYNIYPASRNEIGPYLHIPSAYTIIALTIGEEYWMGFSMYIPEDYVCETGDRTHEMHMQIHGVPDPGEVDLNPCSAIYFIEDKIQISYRADSKKFSGATPEEVEYTRKGGYTLSEPWTNDRGKWTDWVFHFKLSYNSDGWMKVYKNGKLVVDDKGGNCYNDIQGPHITIGTYKVAWKNGKTEADERTVFFDEFRLGGVNSTYEEIAPGDKSVLQDHTPPTGSININNDVSITVSRAVTLALSARDDYAGMGLGAEMKFSNDNINWTDPEAFATTKNWTLTLGDGLKTVYVNYKDAAGNWMPTPVSDDIILDTSVTGRLIHNTFEGENEGWGAAIGNTLYETDNSASYAGSYSMHVYATSAGSKLSIGVNPSGWNIDQYPFLSLAYKIPNNVPVGIFFNTDAGWISLGGSKNYNAGSYPINDAYRLADDGSWHVITFGVTEKIREVYPAASTVIEFEWYTQSNAKQGDEFWFDEVMVFADENMPPKASIHLSDPSPTKAGAVEVTLTTSKSVINVPTPLAFLEADNSIIYIELSGAVPGNIFTGIFIVDETVAEGGGYFSLPSDILVDEKNNKGNEITSGAYVKIYRTAPAKPKNLQGYFLN